jgi:hypothetical protein
MLENAHARHFEGRNLIGVPSTAGARWTVDCGEHAAIFQYG